MVTPVSAVGASRPPLELDAAYRERTDSVSQAAVLAAVGATDPAAALSVRVAASKGAPPVTPADASSALREARNAAERIANAQGFPAAEAYAARGVGGQEERTGRLLSVTA
ncbi:hypothetical protein GCM10008171_22290 [Methylopila jiangsuensis]|uniref:Uncharacterized protein n=1 Tax=Methylopila jiangsuensis TaxID=586230 RepID=A0A9W6N451_9HYPH|nr:hypothetical protein [Methylopila jiangsuensis]MDR6286682.1 hypothetical protein [Methylopila jiangsuensis]GLK76975.1 hypothetical protein GCM10008171_22290 [Methylopila jiangsuensis]